MKQPSQKPRPDCMPDWHPVMELAIPLVQSECSAQELPTATPAVVVSVVRSCRLVAPLSRVCPVAVVLQCAREGELLHTSNLFFNMYMHRVHPVIDVAVLMVFLEGTTGESQHNTH